MIFELLFLFCVLISLISLITALVLAIRARRPAAKRVLKVLGVGWLLYLSAVILVSATTPQRVVPMHQDLCFDEMCFAVVDAKTVAQPGPSAPSLQTGASFYVVTVRVTSHSRGRPQSEGGLRALLWSPGATYEVSPAGHTAWTAAHPQSVELTARLRPGESVLSDQVFEVPAKATDLSLVLTHGFTPGYFVIGECPIFHKPTILRISQ